jgi:hypothetical protein
LLPSLNKFAGLLPSACNPNADVVKVLPIEEERTSPAPIEPTICENKFCADKQMITKNTL